MFQASDAWESIYPNAHAGVLVMSEAINVG